MYLFYVDVINNATVDIKAIKLAGAHIFFSVSYMVITIASNASEKYLNFSSSTVENVLS